MEAFLLAEVGRGCNERAARDVCGVLKNGFPRRITLPRRLRLRISLRRFIGCVYTGARMDLFREENFRDVSVSKKNDRPTAADNSLVRPRQNKGSCHRIHWGLAKNSVFNGSLGLVRTSQRSRISRKSPCPKLGYLLSPRTLEDTPMEWFPGRVLNFNTWSYLRLFLTLTDRFKIYRANVPYDFFLYPFIIRTYNKISIGTLWRSLKVTSNLFEWYA